MKTKKQILLQSILLLFSSIFFFQSCSRKADGEEDMKVMIVGTWKAKVKNTMFKDKYHLMEFTYDGKYRELNRDAPGSDNNDSDGWNSADTTGFRGGESYITFGDSVYYYIENSNIKFYTNKSILPYSNFVPSDVKIEWIKPNKLKFTNVKYEKI